MESSKPRTIRGKILMIFILTVIPFMMISALISTYSIETSNERVKASYTTLLEMLKRDIDNDLAIIDSNMRLQFTTNDTLFITNYKIVRARFLHYTAILFFRQYTIRKSRCLSIQELKQSKKRRK